MTSTDTATDVDIEQWRGVAADTEDDLPVAVSVVLRRRTRGLIGSLIRPYKRQAVRVLLAIVIGTAASMAIPALVGIGIDSGIKDARHGDHTTIGLVVAGIAVCALT